jgi:hypothetical protein
MRALAVTRFMGLQACSVDAVLAMLSIKQSAMSYALETQVPSALRKSIACVRSGKKKNITLSSDEVRAVSSTAGRSIANGRFFWIVL